MKSHTAATAAAAAMLEIMLVAVDGDITLEIHGRINNIRPQLDITADILYVH